MAHLSDELRLKLDVIGVLAGEINETCDFKMDEMKEVETYLSEMLVGVVAEVQTPTHGLLEYKRHANGRFRLFIGGTPMWQAKRDERLTAHRELPRLLEQIQILLRKQLNDAKVSKSVNANGPRTAQF